MSFVLNYSFQRANINKDKCLKNKKYLQFIPVNIKNLGKYH